MSQFPPPPPEGQPPGGQQPPGGTPPQPPGGSVPPPPPPQGPPGGNVPPPPPPPPPGPPGGMPPGGGYPPGGPPPGGGYPPGGMPPGGYPPGGGMPPAGGKPFSVGDAFGYGWKKFTENIGPILIAMLVFLLIGLVLYGVQVLVQAVTSPDTTVVTGENGFVITQSGGGFLGVLVSILFSLISFIWGYIVQAAFARGGLALTEGRPLVLGELLTFNKLGRIILAGILLSIMTFIGFLLCIIPGLIVAFFGAFFVYFILDQDLGAVDSLKASFSFVKDNVGNLLLLLILSWLALLAGALVCGIGLFVAVPVVVIAHTYAYKVLRGQPVAA